MKEKVCKYIGLRTLLSHNTLCIIMFVVIPKDDYSKTVKLPDPALHCEIFNETNNKLIQSPYQRVNKLRAEYNRIVEAD